jgi:hypothetical protein
VDARQLDLIQLQREVLDVLQNQSISVDMISITGIAGVKDRYLRLNEALKSGLINQQEYDKTKISIDKDYKVIENLYNKVMSLPIGTPRQHYATWIRANYSAISGVSKSSSGVSTGTNTLNKDKLREDLLKAAEERKLPSCKALYWKSAGFSSDYKRSIENTPKAYCTLKDGTPIPAQFKDVTSETGETIKLMKMLDFTGTTKYYPWD